MTLELLDATPKPLTPELRSGAGLGAAPCSVNPSKWKDHVSFRSAHVEWGTPPDLKADLDKEFGFTLDPCKPGQVWDGTEISWAGHRVFCNPPYGRTLGKWLAKGPDAEVAVFLVPARTDTAWFHDHALKADEIRFFRGRLKFSENHIAPRDDQDAAPFPSMLVIYRRKDSPNSDYASQKPPRLA
jgi:site-specific DNA-methyltransferase (adenine-specific)